MRWNVKNCWLAYLLMFLSFQVDDQIYENGYIYFSDETLTDKEVYCFGLIDVLTKYV